MRLRLGLLAGLLSLLFVSATFAQPKKAAISTELNVDKLRPGDTVVLAITLDIPEGLHAQSNKPLDESLIPTTLKLTGGAKLLSVVYPEGHVEEYPALGKVSVYTGKVTLLASLEVAQDASAGAAEIAGSVRYQMCDDKICFAPVTDQFTVKTTVAAAGEAVNVKKDGVFAGFDPAKASPTTAPAAVAETPTPPPATVSDGTPTSFAGAILVALLAGIIFNVMPCVLPVLPLKAVGFYEASHHDRSRTILFGVSFSLGMTGIFAALALVLLLSKALLGRQIAWGELFSHTWFVWTVAIVLAALALSMLKGAAIRLPTSIYGLNFRHDTMVGNFMWGGLTAILSTPCTAFFFPAILAYAFAQPLIVGFIVITTVGVGMALPYLLLSAVPELARRFPRTGPFAELFKQMMGFLLLASAGFFFGLALLHDPNQWWLVYAVIVIASIYLIARTKQLMRTRRAVVIAAAVALLLSGGGFVGAQMLTRPTKGFTYYTPDEFARARESGDVVLVKFTASWCLNCKYIEQSVFQDDATLADLQGRHVRMLKADLTASDAAGWDLLTQLGGKGIPFTAVWPPTKEGQPLVLDSIYTRDALLATVDRAKGTAVAAR